MSKSKASKQREQERNRQWKKRKPSTLHVKNPCDLEYSTDIPDFRKAVKLPVQVEASALPLKCWQNCAKKVELDGGKVVNGWSIDEKTAPGVRRLIAHAVWESPTGQRIEITPDKVYDLFLEDERAGPGKPVGYCLKDNTTEAITRMIELVAFEHSQIESGIYR